MSTLINANLSSFIVSSSESSRTPLNEAAWNISQLYPPIIVNVYPVPRDSDVSTGLGPKVAPVDLSAVNLFIGQIPNDVENIATLIRALEVALNLGPGIFLYGSCDIKRHCTSIRVPAKHLHAATLLSKCVFFDPIRSEVAVFKEWPGDGIIKNFSDSVRKLYPTHHRKPLCIEVANRDVQHLPTKMHIEQYLAMRSMAHNDPSQTDEPLVKSAVEQKRKQIKQTIPQFPRQQSTFQ